MIIGALVAGAGAGLPGESLVGVSQAAILDGGSAGERQIDGEVGQHVLLLTRQRRQKAQGGPSCIPQRVQALQSCLLLQYTPNHLVSHDQCTQTSKFVNGL